MVQKIKRRINKLTRFLTYDIWRINKDDTSSSRFNIYSIIKTFILTYRNIDASQLNTRAAALTYNTFLSVVPLLAVLLAIARGFGFQNILESQLFTYFQGQNRALEKALTFVDQSLQYASGGIFLGIGLILLLYTVINLLSEIEGNFNIIWRVKEGRSYYRQFTDYIALFIIIPVFIICNAGITIFLTSSLEYQIIGTLVSPFMKIIPFFLTIFLFTFIYIYIPNTKVNFLSGLFGGIFAGITFQFFQIIYISGQIWISKYNAIYGSFAALPLLLLWLQLSWYICLIGLQLAFAFQNIKKFSFEREIKTISRRYKDFAILLISKLIIKRFETGEEPYTADELSDKYKIPTQLTTDTLYFLHQIGIIKSTPTKDDRILAYIPAIDINKITLGYLFEKADLFGSEDFQIDTCDLFNKEWTTIINLRSIDKSKDVLVKDI